MAKFKPMFRDVRREPSQTLPSDPPAGAGAVAAPAESMARDVAWKAWDGLNECLASVCGQSVLFWTQGDDGLEEEGEKPAHWRVVARVPLGEDVWKVSWSDVGGILLVSLGGKEQRTTLLKQRLDGVWDVMDVAVQEK